MPLDLLIVEDDRTVGQLLEFIAGENGMKAKVAETLAEARELLQEGYPTACILDYNLADGTGIELAKEVMGETKIYFLSGRHPDDVLESAQAYGIQPHGVWHKPFKVERVKELLQEAISSGTKSDTQSEGFLQYSKQTSQ